MPAGSDSLHRTWISTVWRATTSGGRPHAIGEARRLPRGIERVTAMARTLEARAPVGVGVPQFGERRELREVRERVLRGLRHRHLVVDVTPVRLGRRDPESLRRLFREEPWLLARRQRTDE